MQVGIAVADIGEARVEDDDVIPLSARCKHPLVDWSTDTTERVSELAH